jgi:hypothetical protein
MMSGGPAHPCFAAEVSWQVALKMGSMTSLHACCSTRSRTVGIPYGHAIDPAHAAIGADLLPGPPQNIGPEDAVIPRMEPAVPAPLGRQVESALELS